MGAARKLETIAKPSLQVIGGGGSVQQAKTPNPKVSQFTNPNSKSTARQSTKRLGAIKAPTKRRTPAARAATARVKLAQQVETAKQTTSRKLGTQVAAKSSTSKAAKPTTAKHTATPIAKKIATTKKPGPIKRLFNFIASMFKGQGYGRLKQEAMPAPLAA